MSKLYIWIGTFEDEKAFERYYDGEDSAFSREIGANIDYDFMAAIYREDWLRLLSIVPAKYDAFQKALKEKGVTQGNALIYHNKSELRSAKPENSESMTFIGCFDEAKPTPLITDEESRLGFTDIIWAGKSTQSRDEFMKYFEQGGAFCSDINRTSYDPEKLTIYFTEKVEDINLLIKQIKNDSLRNRLLQYFERNELKNVNVLVHYAQDGTHAAKSKIQIYPLKLLNRYPLPKGYTAEIESYNGLKYIGSFGWE
jgi:hypothetical protein